MEAREVQLAPTRGARQRQRTRSALLTAGQRLFALHAVDSVTIDDIVGTADVAKGSFYNHFDDKKALADAVFGLVHGDVEFHIFAANSDVEDPPMRIARAFCTVVRYARTHPERLQALLSLAERRLDASSPLNVGVGADLRRGLEQGRLRHCDTTVGTLIVIGLINVAVRHALSTPPDVALKTLAGEMAAGMLRGLGVELSEARRYGIEAATAILTNE